MKVPYKLAAQQLAACERRLAGDLDADVRGRVERQAELLRSHLGDRCRECGRPLENARSVELGIGPECRAKRHPTLRDVPPA